MLGKRVFFLTGTDEHGEKVQKTPRRKASPPGSSPTSRDQLPGPHPGLTISNTDFIRTTEPRHYASVQRPLPQVARQRDIYLETTRWYCVPTRRTGRRCSSRTGIARRAPPRGEAEEPSFFFRSRNTRSRSRLLPETPVVHPAGEPPQRGGRLRRGGLNDLSVSRTSLSWGIPVPERRGM